MFFSGPLPYSRLLKVNDKKAYVFCWTVFFIAFFVALDNKYTDIHQFLTRGTDSLGYYQYLPSIFIEGSFKPDKWVIFMDDGSPLSLFSFGVAILQLPFFFLGHMIAHLGGYETNGYSSPYALTQFIGTAFYLAIAMRMLWAYLISLCKWQTVLVTLASLYLGTNLFYYSSFEPGMSHVYNFFVMAAIVLCTHKLFETGEGKYLIYLGVLAGITVVVKPYNILGFIFVFAYHRYSLKEKITYLTERWKYLLLGAGAAMIFLLLQIAYWKHITGNYLVFSYGLKDEGFNWGSPELINVLFSHQNGWLVYSPLMLFSLIGLWFMYKKQSREATGVLLIWLLAWYLIASWWAWWFGAAYGHRAFIEFYALLAIPLAYFFQYVSTSVLRRKVALFFVFVFCFLNIRMSHIYKAPWDGDEWTWVRFNNVLNHALYINQGS